MDLIKLRQFHIVTHFKVDFSLIIDHLIYLTFSGNLIFELVVLINFYNQLSQLIYIKLVVLLAYDILFS